MDKVGNTVNLKKMQKRKAQQKPVWPAQLLFLDVSLSQTARNCQDLPANRR